MRNIIAILSLALAAGAHQASSQDPLAGYTPDWRSQQESSARAPYEVLAGINSVSIGIYLSIGDDVPLQEEFAKERARTAVELELRKSGILVTEDAPQSLTMGFVFVGDDNVVSYGYRARMSEWAVPNRIALIDPQARYAAFRSPSFWLITWSYGTSIRMMPATALLESVVEDAIAMARRFANDYLRANP